MSTSEPLHSRVAGRAIETFFTASSSLAGALPIAKPEFHGIERLRDIPYRRSGHRAHTLDIYRPPGCRQAPVVFYIHGGGFRFLSKDSHWIMALGFALKGYLVVCINYRLAPRHPFPAALVDSCHAFDWVHRHIEAYGGNPEEIIVAGESAGANLAANIVLASCQPFPEAWMRRIHALGTVPRAAILACGILQVSEPERYLEKLSLPPWIYHRVAEVGRAYLAPSSFKDRRSTALADPLVILETLSQVDRPLPPIFAPVGTADPLLDDTLRLEKALRSLEVPVDARYYPGELHAFHAFVFRRQARQCWRDTYAFLDRYAPPRQSPVFDLTRDESSSRVA